MIDGALEKLRSWRADVAVVLGSGLNELPAEIENAGGISYENFGDIPKPTVAGHTGEFVLARMGGPIILARGRVHLYEGHTATQVTAMVRILASAGVKQIILTNAAGSVNTNFGPRSWMLIRDHLNLTGTSPLSGPQFIDLTETYSARMRTCLESAATLLGVRLESGVYASLRGPQYETPAEVNMLRTLGADAVGMSTVLEAIQARALGIEVAALSCITNLAAGVSGSGLSHSDVLSVGQSAAGNFWRIFSAAVPKLIA